jgi:hypothetical protein
MFFCPGSDVVKKEVEDQEKKYNFTKTRISLATIKNCEKVAKNPSQPKNAPKIIVNCFVLYNKWVNFLQIFPLC